MRDEEMAVRRWGELVDNGLGELVERVCGTTLAPSLLTHNSSFLRTLSEHDELHQVGRVVFLLPLDQPRPDILSPRKRLLP